MWRLLKHQLDSAFSGVFFTTIQGRTNEETDNKKFEFRIGNGNRNAFSLLKAIGKVMYAVLIDLERAFDWVYRRIPM